MNLFADYIQPLTDWLQTNPNWSLFITFIISLSESLVIIGIIVPGSVTMTAIGILAGSGVMRLDYTLIAAIMGAICGDSLSYALGLIYSDRLNNIWPFSKYPKWLDYGKDFFKQHGGKSVLIGRFVGPLRALIPIVAGMMHMKQWRFLVSNILSAIGWSIVYIMPGALIGAASKELSAEIATRLFLTVLFVLVSFWLISIAIKWLFVRLHRFYEHNVDVFWSHLKDRPYSKHFYNALTPNGEDSHYVTVLLTVMTSLCLLSFIILSFLNNIPHGLNSMNTSIDLLMQSLQTGMLKAFFIVCTQYTNTITITTICIFVSLWCIQHKHYALVGYIISLIITSIIISSILPSIYDNAWSSNSLVNNVSATALTLFLVLCINTPYAFFTHAIKACALGILTMCALGTLYLGDISLSNLLTCLFAGAFIGLIHYQVYRTFYLDNLNTPRSMLLPCLFFIAIMCSMLLSTHINYKTMVYDHLPNQQEHVISEPLWWGQTKPILPIYRLNRIGRKISLLNVQYNGPLEQLKNTLISNGWEEHNESFTAKLLMRMNKKDDLKFPLLSQLYENKPPKLVLTYKATDGQTIWVFYLWTSHYRMKTHNNLLWIGSIYQIYPHLPSKGKQDIIHATPLPQTLYTSLSAFNLKRLDVYKSLLKPTVYPTMPMILLIKEK